VGGDDELARGRDAAGRLAWANAYAAFSAADQSSPLAMEDLELLGTAATSWVAWRIVCGRCSTPSSCMPRPAIPGGPRGARSG
jgi:hypothetical protein